MGRPAALALLASAMTLVITVVNNLTYFHRSPVAQTVYGKRDLNVTFAGELSALAQLKLQACQLTISPNLQI